MEIKSKIKNITFFGIMLMLMATTCVKDSPLSEVELNDPSVIRPSIYLERTWDANDSLRAYVRVYLYDKNNHSIELQTGSVSMNDIPMQVEYTSGGGPFYTLNSSILNIELNKSYNFIIKLSDGKAYACSVTTQSEDLYELELPSNYNSANNMLIHWNDRDITSEFEIELNCTYSSSSKSSKGQTTDIFTPNQQERTEGAYSIHKSYFNQEPNIYMAKVIVRSKVYGEVDPGFDDGSKIYSSFSKYSVCDVN